MEPRKFKLIKEYPGSQKVGIIAATRQDDIYPTAENISELSYKYADEMLKQENL